VANPGTSSKAAKPNNLSFIRVNSDLSIAQPQSVPLVLARQN